MSRQALATLRSTVTHTYTHTHLLFALSGNENEIILYDAVPSFLAHFHLALFLHIMNAWVESVSLYIVCVKALPVTHLKKTHKNFSPDPSPFFFFLLSLYIHEVESYSSRNKHYFIAQVEIFSSGADARNDYLMFPHTLQHRWTPQFTLLLQNVFGR